MPAAGIPHHKATLLRSLSQQQGPLDAAEICALIAGSNAHHDQCLGCACASLDCSALDMAVFIALFRVPSVFASVVRSLDNINVLVGHGVAAVISVAATETNCSAASDRRSAHLGAACALLQTAYTSALPHLISRHVETRQSWWFKDNEHFGHPDHDAVDAALSTFRKLAAPAARLLSSAPDDDPRSQAWACIASMDPKTVCRGVGALLSLQSPMEDWIIPWPMPGAPAGRRASQDEDLQYPDVLAQASPSDPIAVMLRYFHTAARLGWPSAPDALAAFLSQDGLATSTAMR